MSETFRIGLLGHGTVGAAFAQLVAERADAIVPVTGLRPEVTGILTRSQGTFEEVLDGADLIVELMGGIEPAREYVLAAMRAGRHVVSANKQLLSQHGEELWACAREHGVQLRFEGAVAGVVPVIRDAAGVARRVARRAHPRDRQRHDQLHPHGDGALRPLVRRGARAGADAGLRRGRPDRRRHRPRRRRQDGDPRPPGVLHPGAPRPGRLRGDRAPHGARTSSTRATSGWG